MKFRDILKLIRHEYRYEKSEWILSAVLQILIYVSVFFLLTVACDIDEVCGEYVRPLYPDGYEFMLKGYNAEDIAELERKGFYEITISDYSGDGGYGVRDSLNGIWLYKFQAVASGKDIWNDELDEILSVIFFCQITFAAIGAVMLAIMLNNLSNSFAMKLMRRKRYIQMLEQLGCAETICRRIYYGFFCIRGVPALVLAAGINMYLIRLLNRYMAESMYISASFAPFHWVLAFGIGVISVCLMRISFWKQWRQADEN